MNNNIYGDFKPANNNFVNINLYVTKALEERSIKLREYEPFKIISYSINGKKYYLNPKYRKLRKILLIKKLSKQNFKNHRKLLKI